MNKITNIKKQIGFSIKNKINTVGKTTTNIESYIDSLPKDMKSILEKLNLDAEKISSTAYKLENYILLPQHSFENVQMMSNASKYMDNNKSILKFAECKNISESVNLYVYKIDSKTSDLIKYNKNIVTDKAKQNFYYDLKELIQNGRVDITEILDQTKWYMTKDGQTMYHISPHLDGYITHSERDNSLKKLFDTLFNDAKNHTN